MHKFIFTFGLDHPFKDYVQIIYAKDMNQARTEMFHVYGANWAFQYSEDNAPEREYKELPAIYCKE